MGNQFDLTGKVAVVTGANGNFGSEFSRVFAENGADLVLAVRDPEKGKEMAEKLCAEYGVEVLPLTWEATDVESIKQLAKDAAAWKEHVDIVVNNAGGNRTTSSSHFFDRSDDDIRIGIEMNLLSVLYCCREFGRLMKEQRSGSIINIASIAGIVGRDRRMYYRCGKNENLIDYAAAKGGVISATRDLAAVLGPYGVRVNSISPGGFANGCPGDFQELYGEATPLGRMGKPGQELGSAGLYLASDASSYVNGHNLVVDGGFTIWR